MTDEQCIFCMIANNKIQSAKLYEDALCIAFLDIKPATKGHVQVISKVHSPIFMELDEVSKNKIFNIALSIGQTLIKKLNANGVSYIINEGVGAGQRVAHCSIHVIPRYEGDEVSIGWPDKQMNQEDLTKYINEIITQVSTKNESSIPVQKPTPHVEKKSNDKLKEKKEEVIKLKPRIPRYW
jgi:histidine triad (HIT) family protein